MNLQGTVSNLALVVGLFAGSPVFTATVNIAFSGTVTTAGSASPGMLPSSIVAGTVITGTISYDSAAAISIPRPTSSSYPEGTLSYSLPSNAQFAGLSINAGGYSWNTGGAFEATIVDSGGSGESRYDQIQLSYDSTSYSASSLAFPFSLGHDEFYLDVVARNNNYSSDGLDVDFIRSNRLPEGTADINFNPLAADDYFAEGILFSRGPTGEGYYLGFDVDTASFRQIVSQPPTDPSAIVYIDFDSGVSAFFKTVENSFNQKESYVVSDGYMSASNFSESDRNLIVAEVQRIFASSGTDILVTQIKPTSGEFYSVEMANALDSFDSNGDGVRDALLTGKAYDIVKIELLNKALGNYGIDRFDKRKDGRVAVFYDGGSDIYNVSETIAHEVGHGLGGFHIDPNSRGSQVLDYTDALPGTAIFYNQVTNMVDFNNGGALLAETHNPQYHIRRFVDGETKSGLAAQGLQPGTWDSFGFKVFGYQIDLSSLSNFVSDWFVATNDATDNLTSVNGASASAEYSAHCA